MHKGRRIIHSDSYGRFPNRADGLEGELASKEVEAISYITSAPFDDERNQRALVR